MMTTLESTQKSVAYGAAQAALLAAGIGTFAMGLIVILTQAGLIAIPALYAPAGGVSGRTTLAVLIWLAAWAVLHRRWKTRTSESNGVQLLSWVLIAAGILLTFPPIWSLF